LISAKRKPLPLMPAKSLTLENGRKVSGAYARAAPIRLLGASSGAQRVSARLPPP